MPTPDEFRALLANAQPEQLQTIDAFRTGLAGLQAAVAQIRRQVEGQPRIAAEAIDALLGDDLAAFHRSLGELLAVLRPGVTAPGGQA